jgi:hypothetical protein
MKTSNVLAQLINSAADRMSGQYERMKEVIEYVENYFDFNIDDVAGNDIGSMTLDELRAILDRKISLYSKYVRNSDGTFREIDPLEEWIKEGAKKNHRD